MPKITSNEGKPYAEIGTLLRNLRLRRGMSQFDLADASGINNSYLSRIENGERRPSPKILKRFSEILQFPYDELVVTSGILSEDFVKSTPSEPSSNDPTTHALQQLISGIQGKPAGSNGSSAVATARRAMPVYDTVPAGLLKDANVVEAHADVEKLVLSEEEMMFDPNSFGLIVQGDSMLEAGILDGDTLIVSPASQVNNGDIAVVQVNRRQTTVKKVYFENDSVILQPANHNYRPQVLKYPDEVEILGRVILVGRKAIWGAVTTGMSKVNDQHLDEIAAARAQTDYNRAVEPCGPSCGCAGPLRGAEEDFETRLKAALEKVRPFLQMDGGDLELVAIEDNNALIRLMGACQSCSISTVHMKMGVETAIKKEIPEFGELITID